jgi:predicted enzyme related to lactoylglutathione lyase
MNGFICHFDIPAREPEKTAEFYKKIFEWKIDTTSFPGYHAIETSKPPGGGIEKRDPFTPGILVYIQVDDIPSVLEKIKASGGQVIKGKTEIPNIGYFGIFNDPDGNIIGLYSEK